MVKWYRVTYLNRVKGVSLMGRHNAEMKSANQEQCSSKHLNGVKKHSTPIATSKAFQLKEMKDNTCVIDRNDRFFKSV